MIRVPRTMMFPLEMTVVSALGLKVIVVPAGIGHCVSWL
jgi:hypothetical protein